MACLKGTPEWQSSVGTFKTKCDNIDFIINEDKKELENCSILNKLIMFTKNLDFNGAKLVPICFMQVQSSANIQK